MTDIEKCPVKDRELASRRKKIARDESSSSRIISFLSASMATLVDREYKLCQARKQISLGMKISFHRK